MQNVNGGREWNDPRLYPNSNASIRIHTDTLVNPLPNPLNPTALPLLLGRGLTFYQIMKNKTKIQSIVPYLFHHQWVFDSDRHGLYQEEFVCGMTQIIDAVLDDNGIEPMSVASGFRLTFSANRWPESTHVLQWLHEEDGGNVYEIRLKDGSTMQGWLCPALLCFFDKAPKQIHVSVAEI